jgi:hypothetical protein
MTSAGLSAYLQTWLYLKGSKSYHNRDSAVWIPGMEQNWNTGDFPVGNALAMLERASSGSYRREGFFSRTKVREVEQRGLKWVATKSFTSRYQTGGFTDGRDLISRFGLADCRYEEASWLAGLGPGLPAPDGFHSGQSRMRLQTQPGLESAGRKLHL